MQATLRAIAVVSALWFAAAAPVAAAEGKIQATIGDDGLHKQSWFLESFLVLSEDLAEATAAGKRFAIVWEQRACPYCRDMHEINLADPKVNQWIRERFVVLQLNLWGDRQVTDFDGQVLSEKDLARKFRINFTPTLQFFPEKPEDMAGKKAADAEVARMPGYFRPFHFISMFEYVHGKLYDRMDFQRYIVEKAGATRGSGRATN